MLGSAKAGYVLMPPRMDGLALGALIFALASLRQLDRWRAPALWAGIVAFVAGAATMALRDEPWASVVLGIAASVFHAALLTRVLTGSEPRLDRPWLRVLGRYSYGVYVIHYPLILVLRPLFDWARTAPAIGSWSLPTATVCFISGSGLSLVLAMASYHLFERHFLRLKDRLAPSPERPPALRREGERGDAGVAADGR